MCWYSFREYSTWQWYSSRKGCNTLLASNISLNVCLNPLRKSGSWYSLPFSTDICLCAWFDCATVPDRWSVGLMTCGGWPAFSCIPPPVSHLTVHCCRLLCYIETLLHFVLFCGLACAMAGLPWPVHACILAAASWLAFLFHIPFLPLQPFWPHIGLLAIHELFYYSTVISTIQ